MSHERLDKKFQIFQTNPIHCSAHLGIRKNYQVGNNNIVFLQHSCIKKRLFRFQNVPNNLCVSVNPMKVYPVIVILLLVHEERVDR